MAVRCCGVLRGCAAELDKEEPQKVVKSAKEEFQAANEGAAGPAGSARAFLKARMSKMALETSVGTVKVVKSDEAGKSSGYYCEVCECGLKDSVAGVGIDRGLLGGVSDAPDLRKLGYSMRVERSTVDQVKNRLQSASKRKWDPLMTKKLDAMEGRSWSCASSCDGSSSFAAEEEQARVKRQKKEQKKAKKLGKAAPSPPSSEKRDQVAGDHQPQAAEDVPDADAQMMAMMGFGGFGGSKKC
ncbi:unnamed protein product [Phytophthora fragariaefolia]|uniref:Unnamed protein product n=1 Tax=Phytophthora fragariaefolia TaxID=1490495 RepID=A0A9W6U8A9_9STRA|nr:unnamed protein product [Phytophthora fragariaefolia]